MKKNIQTVAVPMEVLSELIVEQLQQGGRAKLNVTGISMMPMLYNRRDAVLLIPVSHRQKRGDVILYRRENGRYVLHRIIAVTSNGYICSGDNQAMREPVAHQQLIAVVDGFIRNGKNYTLDHPGYRFYQAVWVGLFPLRPAYIALRRWLGKIRRRILYGG